MNFKIHLIIVSIIIIAVYFSWQISMRMDSAQQTVVQQENDSPYKISIISASYGLNCDSMYSSDPQPQDPYAFKKQSNAKSKKNNVLDMISKACNDKLQCTIIVKPELLGGDPDPNCGGEALEIEYRCFSFDRLWTARSTRENIVIDCTNAEARPAQ